MASNTSQPKLSLKVMVHKEEKKAIFAEADSHFVDTLFSIMTLPMATILRLLQKLPDDNLNWIGSFNNLYQSLLNLSTNCLSSEENKWLLLNPKTSSHDICRKLKLNIDDEEPVKHFICQDLDCSRRSGARFSTCKLAKCSNCGMMMDREIIYEDSTGNMGVDGDGGVFVSDLTNFIVTDDLRVMPNSPVAIIQLLCESGITEVSCLDDMTVDIGLDQILIILKGALLSKHPLTYLVFHGSDTIYNLVVNPIQEPSFNHVTSSETMDTSKNVMLKVTMQKSTSKFLFAEADSDVVEFVFGFLQIPLGTMIGEFMNGANSFESLNNLYSSISNLSVGEYIKSQDLKTMLLQPQLVHTYLSTKKIFPLRIFQDSKSYCHSYLYFGTLCANMTRSVNRQGHEKEMFCTCSLKDSRVEGRYLKTSAKFMVTDDLVITLFSYFSSITMLGNLQVPLNDIEVHNVSIDIEEGLDILNASLKSKSTLTDSVLKSIVETKN